MMQQAQISTFLKRFFRRPIVQLLKKKRIFYRSINC